MTAPIKVGIEFDGSKLVGADAVDRVFQKFVDGSNKADAAVNQLVADTSKLGTVSETSAAATAAAAVETDAFAAASARLDARMSAAAASVTEYEAAAGAAAVATTELSAGMGLFAASSPALLAITAGLDLIAQAWLYISRSQGEAEQSAEKVVQRLRAAADLRADPATKQRGDVATAFNLNTAAQTNLATAQQGDFVPDGAGGGVYVQNAEKLAAAQAAATDAERNLAAARAALTDQTSKALEGQRRYLENLASEERLAGLSGEALDHLRNLSVGLNAEELKTADALSASIRAKQEKAQADKDAAAQAEQDRQAIDRLLDSINKEHIGVTVGKDAWNAYQLVLLGATDAQIKHALATMDDTQAEKDWAEAAKDAARIAEQQQKAVESTLDGLAKQATSVTVGKDAWTLYTLVVNGATDAQIKQAIAFQDTIDASDAATKMQKQLTEEWRKADAQADSYAQKTVRIGEALSRSVTDATLRLLSFQSSFSQFLTSLVDAVDRALASIAAKAVSSSVGGLLGDLFGSGIIAAPTFALPGANAFSGLPGLVSHTGGLVGGGGGVMREVSASLFSGARRMHSGGLAGDEVPAILQKGEMVLSKAQVAAGSAGGGDTFHQEIHLHVNAIDTRSATQWLKENGSTIAVLAADGFAKSKAIRAQAMGAR